MKYALAAVLFCLLFPETVVRTFWRTRAHSPVPLPAGVHLIRADRLCWLIGLPSGITASAVTLGASVICVYGEPEAHTVRHELVHARQAKRDGWLYRPRYLWLWIRHGYQDHPYEVEARDAAHD